MMVTDNEYAEYLKSVKYVRVGIMTEISVDSTNSIDLVAD